MSLLLLDSRRARPAPVKQPPLPPWDENDPGGDVHTSPPPEWQPPPAFTDRLWPRCDFGIDVPGAPAVPGGSSNTDLVCTYMLPQYQNAAGRSFVDRLLTAICERSYDTILFDRFCADLAGWSSGQLTDLMQYAQSWGLFTPIWGTSSSDARYDYASVADKVGPLLSAMASKRLGDKSVFLPGEELNNGTTPGAPLDDLITQSAKRANDAGMAVALHFTAEVGAWPQDGRPFPDWYRQWGPGQSTRVHALWYQADPWRPAGYSGARMYDWRRILAQASPEFRFTPFEYMLARRFENNDGTSEPYSRLRGTELIWCPAGGDNDPRGNPGVPSCSGFGNGASYADGSAI